MLVSDLMYSSLGTVLVVQPIRYLCDSCNKECVLHDYNYYMKKHLKYNKDLCRGCKIKALIHLGLYKPNTVAMNNRSTSNKGKTIRDIYGDEKATSMQIKMSTNGTVSQRNRDNIGKTYEELYGVEKATKLKHEASLRIRGTNNPMYGKPSNFITKCLQGFYKGHYFRSSYELTYLVYLINTGTLFESGELCKHRIEYVYEGITKSYFPDFYLVKEGLTIEIKPERLVNTPINIAKFTRARELLGDSFIILTEKDLQLLTKDAIDIMYYYGLITLKEKKGKFLCI